MGKGGRTQRKRSPGKGQQACRELSTGRDGREGRGAGEASRAVDRRVIPALNVKSLASPGCDDAPATFPVTLSPLCLLALLPLPPGCAPLGFCTLTQQHCPSIQEPADLPSPAHQQVIGPGKAFGGKDLHLTLARVGLVTVTWQ